MFDISLEDKVFAKITLNLNDVKKDKLDKFLNARSNDLVLCNSNGEVSICSQGDVWIFRVAKYGSGGDGKIQISIPSHKCIDVFNEALRHINTLPLE